MTSKIPNFEIRIRTYQDSDSKKIQQLFRNSIIIGVDSPMVVALRAQFTSRFALASYTITGLGAFIAAWSLTTLFRYGGLFLCFLGSTPFCFFIYNLLSGFLNFADHAVKTDLKDVANAYGLTKVETGIENGGGYIAQGANGFWVAELYEEGTMHPEVVGCVGLDTTTMNTEDNNAIELRRMVVSSKYRRRGIAGSLIKVAIAHAQAHGMRYIELTTSSYQKSALDLYEKHGWVIRQRWILMGKKIYTHKLRRYLSDKS